MKRDICTAYALIATHKDNPNDREAIAHYFNKQLAQEFLKVVQKRIDPKYKVTLITIEIIQ